MIETPQSIEIENSRVRIHEFKDAEQIRFLSKSGLKFCFYYTFNVLTLGLLILFFHWLELHVYLYNSEDDFEHATHVLVVTSENKYIIIPVEKDTLTILPINDEDAPEPSPADSRRQPGLAGSQSRLEVIRESQGGRIDSLNTTNKLANFLKKKEHTSGSGLELGDNVLSELLEETQKAPDESEARTSRDQLDLLNPANRLLLNSKGKVTKRFIRFAKRKYFFDESSNTFIPLETVFETHVLRRPKLIRQMYRYGNSLEAVERLRATFKRNELEIEQNAWIYDVVVALFHPMNFGILLLVIVCYICNKMAEAIGESAANAQTSRFTPSSSSSS